MTLTKENVSLFAQVIISVIFLAIFGYLVHWLTGEGRRIDGSVREPLVLVLGTLLGIVASVAGFWLGTSISSAKKDAVISDAMNRVNQQLEQ